MTHMERQPLFPELAPVEGTTGTGLDRWVGTVVNDPGLNHRIPVEDIEGGALAADGINHLIVEAITETGVANDGTLNAADLYIVNDYIQANHAALFTDLHGDDENGSETGFHLVQNDGGTSYLYARPAVDTVLDGAYHIGFDIKNGRFLNEDGNNNQDVEDVAFWLEDALEEDIAAGIFDNPDADPYAQATTGTGLDAIVEVITSDIGLNREIGTDEITQGAEAADQINNIILEAIVTQGLANDGEITASDVYDINAFIRQDPDLLARFVDLHGDDENGEETGFHLVQNDGAESRMFGNDNAVNTVFDGLYHIGFEIGKGRFLNEDGDRNASVETVAHWLDELLEDDLEAGTLVNGAADPFQDVIFTGTGLDLLTTTIIEDEGLNRKIATSDIAAGAEAASEMNVLILDAIFQTGAANDGAISTVDLKDMNAWIQENAFELWVDLHGDDEKNGEETGFHLVQNDGDTSYLFDREAVDTVADGIYHMGFDISRDRFENEDGNRNASLKTVSGWLNGLLAEDLAAGTLVNEDLLPEAADLAAIEAAEILSRDVDAFDGTGPGIDLGHSADFALANGTIALTFTATDLDKRKALFSKDARGQGEPGHLTAWVSEKGVEVRFQDTDDQITVRSSGFTLETGVAYDFAVSFGEGGLAVYLNGVKVAADPDFTVDLTGNTETLVVGANAYARSPSNPDWRADRFEGSIEDFAVYDRALADNEVGAIRNTTTQGPVDPIFLDENPVVAETVDIIGTTGTGLDAWVDQIVNDPGLNHRIDADDIAEGALAADGINHLIVEAIFETGVANDGTLNAADLYNVNRYIQENHFETFVELHGDDEKGEETGFHLVQNDGATDRLYGQNAVNTVLDGTYHIGFDIKRGRFLNEDGNNNQDVEDVAYWLSDALEDDLASGLLVNDAVNPYAVATTGTGLDQTVRIIAEDIGLNREIATFEITEGAEAADQINHIILEAIVTQGLANDGRITASDVYDINAFIQADADLYARFVELHGDDENGEETGFHLVQNDGAETRIFGNDNAVNTVFDGIYHIGFDIDRGRFENEDGNRNASVKTVAFWLDELLEDDLQAGTLVNDAIDPFENVILTGTGLDLLTTTIIEDEGLNRSISTSDIAQGAEAASEMNVILLDALFATGAANDGQVTATDLRAVNAWIQENAYDQWVFWHGDDEKNGEETGFHLVQNDGDTTYLFDEAAVDTVADGLYHIGFDIDGSRFENEDGNRNVSVDTAAYWLNEILAEDLVAGTLVNEDLLPNADDLDGLYAGALMLRHADSFDGTKGGAVDLGHDPAWALANGTISLSFTANEVNDKRVLFSKDFINYQDGGHLTAYVEDGKLEVRFQSTTQSLYLDSGDIDVVAGQTHQMAFTFGEGGARLYLDGQLVDGNSTFTQDLTQNDHTLVLGGGATRRSDRDPGRIDDPFDGEIEGFALFDRAFGFEEGVQITNAPDDYVLPNTDPVAVDDGVFNIAVGETVEFRVALLLANDTDANDDTLDLVSVSDVTGGTVAIDGDVVRFTAGTGLRAAGFTYTVDDGFGGTDQATVALDITTEPTGPRPVFELDTPVLEVAGIGDHVEVAHSEVFELEEGTVALSFNADSPEGGSRDTLFSKDAGGYGDGGHLTAYVQKGDLTVRFQSEKKSVYLKADDMIEADTDYDVAFSFGAEGAKLYLDGTLVDAEADFLQDLTTNEESLAVGANTWSRKAGTPGVIGDAFDGTIDSFAWFDQQLSEADIDLWFA